VAHEAVRNVLAGLGWLPTDHAFAQTKLKEIIERLPGTIRDEVAGAKPILITTRPGTWGVVSHEKHNRLHIRLLHSDLQTLREEAEEVVAKFPSAFEAEFNRDLGFEPEVVIRRFDSEERMVAGQVQDLRNYGFRRYLREVRKRERTTMLLLCALTALTVGGSILMFLLADNPTTSYWRGFLDRGGTTFLTAALTILIAMVLEYRAWTNTKIRIKWAWN
jgi:hypothetical protein